MQHLLTTLAFLICSSAIIAQPQTRLVAEATYRCDSTNPAYYVPRDSTQYFYSGQRIGKRPPFNKPTILQYDSCYVYHRDLSTTTWQPYIYQQQTFNVDDHTLKTTTTNILQNESTYAEYTYTPDKDTELALYYYLDVLSKKTTTEIDSYTYAAPHMISSLVIYTDNGISPAKTTRQSYAYNANGQVVTYHYQDNVNNLDVIYNYHYTGNDVTELEIMSLGANTTRTLYYYTSGRVDSTIGLIFQYTTSSFDTASKTTYNYNASNLVDTIIKYAYTKATGYTVGSATIYEYDAQYNTTAVISQRNFSGNQLENDNKQLYTYNSNNDVTQISSQSWNGAWVLPAHSTLYNYYYETFFATGINNVAKSTANMTIYPIPSTVGFINVNVTWKEAQAFTGGIYNLQGRLINKWSEAPIKEYTHSITTTNLQPGIYVLKLDGAKETASRQFIVQ